MSVILYSKDEVYQEMADAYEGLKHLLHGCWSVDDVQFYKSLRRLYFANVATYLCQYHDDTPLSEAELTSIDGFMSLEGKTDATLTTLDKVNSFLSAWGRLQYNLTTNDGERYEAREAYAYIANLATAMSRAIIEQLSTNSS